VTWLLGTRTVIVSGPTILAKRWPARGRFRLELALAMPTEQNVLGVVSRDGGYAVSIVLTVNLTL
jgi:hypothetical protein